jgi:hypothetical protein
MPENNEEVILPLSRRQLFAWLTALGAETAQAQPPVQVKPIPGLRPNQPPRINLIPQSLSLVRPDDLVVMQVQWSGLTRRGAELVAGGSGATLTILLPGQHVQEEALPETSSGVQLKPRPLKARLAEKTRLVFAIPAGTSITYTTEGILSACARYSLVVPTKHGTQPNPSETEIIFPTDLSLTPEGTVGFDLETKPVEREGWVELWRMRLERRGPLKIGQPNSLTVRAIWEPLWGSSGFIQGEPFAPMMQGDRKDLVASMASGPATEVGELTLSALGAWANLRYDNPSPSAKVASWRHRTAMGRDFYVRIVKNGFLYPFGHRAVLVAVSERRFLSEPGTNGSVAYLVKRQFIVVKELEKSTSSRSFPFTKVRLLRQQSPLLDKNLEQGIWPLVGGKNFLWPVEAEDHRGQVSSFESPLAFIPVGYSGPLPTSDSRLSRAFSGQTIALAPSGTPGDTSFATESIQFSSTGSGDAFVPALSKASLRVPALESLTGKAQSITVSYHPKYLASGFASNPTEAFLALATPVGLDLPLSMSGGIVAPDFDFTALSRKLGPVAGAAILEGSFKPTQYFADVTILGGIKLAEILGEGVLGDAPQLLTKSTEEALDKIHRLHWETNKFSNKAIVPSVLEFKGKGATLSLDVVSSVSGAAGGKPQTLSVSFKNFSLILMSVLDIHFDTLAFLSEGGKKPDVIADVDVKFLGALSFINALEPYIPKSGFSDPPSLDVSTSGITAGYTLDLPPISFGVFNLLNLSLGASLTLPFFGDPMRVRFAFCERHRPFTRAVGIFGGGGFLALEATTKGLESLEGALEFGGMLAINLGVAAGAVSVMAGLYFKIEKDKVTFSGYLRANGTLKILGIITISAEIYLGLEYQSSGVMAGEARVSVEIEFAFFSKTVSFTFRKEFAGGKGAEWFPESEAEYASLEDSGASQRGTAPPPLKATLTQTDWSTYWGAFA